jgi:hypothetical protein
MLDQIKLETLSAATHFAHLLSHMSVSALVLGSLKDEEYCAFKMPAVECLTVHRALEIRHFQAALDAGMATVTRLIVIFDFDDENETTKKLESLTRMIRGAVQLNSLTIQTHGRNPLTVSPPRQLFQALEACASITEIQVNNEDGNPRYFTELNVRQLRRITARNSKLGTFVAHPSTFPNDKMLALMLQLHHCPTGLYMLTRRLPEMFSFQKGHCLFPSMVEPNPTRKLRKRRKISYKE